jgi:bifunctional DNA-binding transcriptional regulator/antitoxin component of YhaV-PrlF toxin-antitoxin module
MKYSVAMATAMNFPPNGQMNLPETLRERRKIRPGAALRVTGMGEGSYVTPLPEPSEQELREFIAAAGSLTRAETPEGEAMVPQVITACRKGRTARAGMSGGSSIGEGL